MEEILILGAVVGRGEFQIENDKIKAVKEQKIPTQIKEVESFLEFAKWKQEEEHQRAFEKLKDKITDQLVLTFLKRDGEFRIETDTLKHVIREVLF